MHQNFTPNDLVRLLYRETSVSETLALRAVLTEDLEMRFEFKALFSAFQQLPKVTFRPSDNAIRRVLNYSKATALESHI
jgi:hypothetical protein